MGWVVTRWRAEGLERLLAEDARAGMRETRAEAAAELEALERIAVGLHARVCVKRAALRAGPVVRMPARRPTRRASLRDSGLGELFRATSAG